MPNDCTNILTISASSKELEKILELIKGDDRPLSFNSILPMPEEEKENWYNWHMGNWGTKWDAYEFTHNEFKRLSDEEATIGFMTAWSPPEAAIRELSARFPQAIITLFYYEVGEDFCGEVVYSNAEVIDNQEFTMTSEEGKDFLNERGLSFGDDEEGEEWDDEEAETEN